MMTFFVCTSNFCCSTMPVAIHNKMWRVRNVSSYFYEKSNNQGNNFESIATVEGRNQLHLLQNRNKTVTRLMLIASSLYLHEQNQLSGDKRSQ